MSYEAELLGPRRWGRWVVLGVAVALLAAGAAVAVVSHPWKQPSGSTTGVLDNSYPTSLATVVRETLTSKTQLSGTLGYAGTYQVVDKATGTVTWLPSVGQVIDEGKVLYRVNTKPVVLLYGRVPAFRTLKEGKTGADVKELNVDLVALGYASRSALPPSDSFSAETADALKKLQAALGVKETGRLELAQAVFLPGRLRITTVPVTLGGPAPAGGAILSATSTTRQVSINLNTSQQSEVAVGDRVSITLPDGQTTPGRVSSVGNVASNGSSGSTVPVIVAPTDPKATGAFDQAPVEVYVVANRARHVLAVPTDALLALASGGYAVEVIGPGGSHRLQGVSVGLFDSAANLVQVSGAGLAAGQRVVVPTA
ncbi:MAG TPA: peptidoglycan-binding protein [Acidimicrobiales bacterium]|nr:peptidoglycan-binding protein [Acidimicrobiales bacterium]